MNDAMDEYFIILDVTNNLRNIVAFFWQWNGLGYLTEVLGNSEKTLELRMRSATKPQPITLRGYTSPGQVSVSLNSHHSIDVEPSKKRVPIPVFVDEKGRL